MAAASTDPAPGGRLDPDDPAQDQDRHRQRHHPQRHHVARRPATAPRARWPCWTFAMGWPPGRICRRRLESTHGTTPSRPSARREREPGLGQPGAGAGQPAVGAVEPVVGVDDVEARGHPGVEAALDGGGAVAGQVRAGPGPAGAARSPPEVPTRVLHLAADREALGGEPGPRTHRLRLGLVELPVPEPAVVELPGEVDARRASRPSCRWGRGRRREKTDAEAETWGTSRAQRGADPLFGGVLLGAPGPRPRDAARAPPPTSSLGRGEASSGLGAPSTSGTVTRTGSGRPSRIAHRQPGALERGARARRGRSGAAPARPALG